MTTDTAAIRARTTNHIRMYAQHPDTFQEDAVILNVAADTLDALSDEVERLRRMLDLRGTGPAERYWEGRWRDEAADNERLRAALNLAAKRLDWASGLVANDAARDRAGPWGNDARAALSQKEGE